MKLDTHALLNGARQSAWKRRLLNFILPKLIPFNAPHGFKVIPQKDGGIRVRIPYWRINRNHIKGTHACALATGSEMCAGLSLLERLDPKKHRLIMRTLHMEYHYQAKKHAHAFAKPSDADMEQILREMEDKGVAEYASTVQVKDTDGNLLATGTVTWQVKDWNKVRTRK